MSPRKRRSPLRLSEQGVATSQVQCPSCGESCKKTARFCPSCGVALEATEGRQELTQVGPAANRPTVPLILSMVAVIGLVAVALSMSFIDDAPGEIGSPVAGLFHSVGAVQFILGLGVLTSVVFLLMKGFDEESVGKRDPRPRAGLDCRSPPRRGRGDLCSHLPNGSRVACGDSRSTDQTQGPRNVVRRTQPLEKTQLNFFNTQSDVEGEDCGDYCAADNRSRLNSREGIAPSRFGALQNVWSLA